MLVRLLENVEEFYVLNEQIRDIIAEDDTMGEKIIELFNAMIDALRIEQSYANNLDRSLWKLVIEDIITTSKHTLFM